MLRRFPKGAPNSYAAVLDEALPFVEGDALKDGQTEAFFKPRVARGETSLYEHCARALDISLSLGAHGLPLIGTGDWNDGMNQGTRAIETIRRVFWPWGNGS